MMEITPQEKLALLVLGTLIAAGTVARHAVFRSQAQERLAYTSEAADTINSDQDSSLRRRVASAVAQEARRSQPLAPDEKLDPNTAAEDQLDRLPRVGPALAERIVAYREANGRFSSLEELGEVSGIGPALLETIAPHLTLRGGTRTPAGRTAGAGSKVDLNRASIEELDALPGVGPSLAQRIVEYRRQNGAYKKFEDLENVAGIGAVLRQRIEGAARLAP